MNLQEKKKEGFLNWFSGFACGDGCFTISRRYYGKRKQYPCYEPRFSINQRDDELALLNEIRDRLTIGWVTKTGHARPPHMLVNALGEHYITKPQVQFTVHTIKDCLKLVDIFTSHPIRGKKQQVFEVWVKAVQECAKRRYRNNQLLECYRQELMTLNRYQPDLSVIDKVEEFLHNNKQLNLLGIEKKEV